MKKIFQARKRMLAGAVVLAMVASLTTAIVVALTTGADLPTLAVDGMELRLREDGSIQALFSVSGQNLGDMKFSGGNLLLHYNPDYMMPSDWVSNEELGAVNTRDPSATDANDPLHHLFFRTNEELYHGAVDPFVWRRELDGTEENAGSIGITKPESSSLSLLLALEDGIEDVEGDYIEKVVSKTQEWSYIVCPEGETSVSVGTLSFRVKPEKLPELIEKFAGKSGTEIRADDANRTLLIESYVDEGLTGNEQKWFLQQLKEKGRPPVWQQEQISDENNQARFNITINFIDALVHAEPVEDDITINAYEAYTDAQVSDLALAMQKYADSIRVTYASGVTVDQSMYWGDPATAYNMPEGGPGMIFEAEDGTAYRFTWDENGVDYTLEKATARTSHTDGEGNTYYTYGGFLAATGMTRGADGLYTYTFEDGSSFTYNARGGRYTISQYFTYMEEEGIPVAGGGNPMQRKAYPFPVKISLTVTPVIMTGTEIDNQVLTYAVGAVPYDYDELDLSNRAKLKLDTVLVGVTPTMYITWDPSTIADVKFNNGTDDVYWPKNAGEDTSDRVGDYPFDTSLLRPEIQTAYPWLTVPEEQYDLDSLRRIRDKNDPDRPWPWAEDFEMWAEPDDDTGDLIVNIAKREKDENGNYTGEYEDIPAGTYTVYLYQPDGTYLDRAWFGGTSNSLYQEQLVLMRRTGWTKDVYGYAIRIHTNAFTSATDGHALDRDTLQQYINLGGWFGAELELQGSTDIPKARTDRITAYSRARQNVYLRNYILTDGSTPALSELNQPLFDFTGGRAGLLPVYAGTGLATLVTLPDAVPGERPTQWVMTRYDASTGREPGYLRQFKVDQWNHTNPAGSMMVGSTVIYGEDPADTGAPKAGEPFAASYDYSGFGRVENPVTRNNQVKVRVEIQEEQPEPIDAEALLLTYEQSGDSISYHPHNDTYNVDEVKRVIFNTRQVGYTYQQVVTLTLTNKGDTEVKGISIDPKDISGNAYFTILSAPAVNLAPGASTTFQISYVPNLAVGKYEAVDPGPIRIYASNYSATDPVKTFEAEVEITQGPVREVRLLVRPTDLSMGDAGFVTGVDTANMYDNTAMGNAYAEGSEVWVLTYPKDECALIEAPYYYNGETEEVDGVSVPKKIYLEEYDPADLAAGSPDFRTTDGGERLFKLPSMPSHSITVYVDYYEPIYSKLRLSDLDAYAWEWPEGGTPDGCTDSTGALSEWVDKHEQELREDQSGGYQVIAFDPDREEYLVLLDEQKESCGVAVTLRNVVLPLNALGTNIELTPVSVEMVLDDAGHTRICDDVNGDTGVPTRHYSDSFDAPLPGNSRTVTVMVSFSDVGLDLGDTHIYEGVRVTRTYKVKFVKKYSGEPEHTLHAGNSPYGMIENDDTILNKTAAKQDFDSGAPGNVFSFTDGMTPVKAFAADGTTPLLSNIYWEEAWAPDAGVDYDNWKAEWLSGKSVNFDKVAPALFIYVGEPFDDPGVSDIRNNAGDLIQNTIVERSLTYFTLSGSSNLQRKFNGTTTETLTLDAYTVGNGDAAGYVPSERLELKDENGQVVTNARPGVYKLTYTFLDYDGTTKLSFVRPLIVLTRNGDMNADLSTNEADGTAIQNRFGGTATDPINLPLNSANYPEGDKLLYRYRILDTNNDRNVNNIDANLIREVLRTNSALTEFYLPIDYTNHTDSGTAGGTTP